MAKHLRDKEALRKLIVGKLASKSPIDAKLVWARLAVAASRLPEFLDDLEELLLPYESVPWEVIENSNRLVQQTIAVTKIIGMLSTWTVLCCTFGGVLSIPHALVSNIGTLS